jgi:hypothetical protein
VREKYQRELSPLKMESGNALCVRNGIRGEDTIS